MTRHTAGALVLVVTLGCGKSEPPPVPVVSVRVPGADVKATPLPGPKTEKEAAAPAEKPVVADGGSFAFPADAGGKLLEKTLPPKSPAVLAEPVPAAPKPRKLPAFLDASAVPPADATPAPPRLPMPGSKPAKPTALPDRVPGDFALNWPMLPERGEFATGPLTRQAGPDPAKPAELPVLSAKPVPDRASLADPTTEFTARSVISPTLPLRTEPAGFLKFNLPDPFENSAAARPQLVVPENPNRALGTIPPPR
jgi:hypothetical protein